MRNPTQIIAEPGKQELLLTREFDAPRELVFQAFTDPTLLSQWYLPSSHKMRIDFMEYKKGGSYRFVMPDAQGNEVGIFGVVHEVLARERISKTFEYEGLPEKGHLALQKTTFEMLSLGRTKVTVLYVCESVTFRDGLVMSGMEAHSAQCYSSLDQLILKLKL